MQRRLMITALYLTAIFASMVSADVTTDDATARLREREAEHAAAATRPAEIDRLRAENSKLRIDLAAQQKELANARSALAASVAELNNLKKSTAAATSPGAPAAKNPADDNAAAIKKAIAEHRVIPGMTEKDVLSVLPQGCFGVTTFETASYKTVVFVGKYITSEGSYCYVQTRIENGKVVTVETVLAYRIVPLP